MDTITHFYLRRKQFHPKAGTVEAMEHPEKNYNPSLHRFGCIAIERVKHVILPARTESFHFNIAFSLVSPRDAFITKKARDIALGKLKSSPIGPKNKHHSFVEVSELPNSLEKLFKILNIEDLASRHKVHHNTLAREATESAYQGAIKNLTESPTTV